MSANRFAELIVATLGERSTTVMVRLSAFVLLCIGIEIILSGYNAIPGIGR
jgi:multiple antibiotic resistance protein